MIDVFLLEVNFKCIVDSKTSTQRLCIKIVAQALLFKLKKTKMSSLPVFAVIKSVLPVVRSWCQKGLCVQTPILMP